MSANQEKWENNKRQYKMYCHLNSLTILPKIQVVEQRGQSMPIKSEKINQFIIDTEIDLQFQIHLIDQNIS